MTKVELKVDDKTRRYYMDRLSNFCHDNIIIIDLKNKDLITHKFFDGFYRILYAFNLELGCREFNIVELGMSYHSLDMLERGVYHCEQNFLDSFPDSNERKNTNYIEGAKWCFILIKRFIKLEKEEWRKRNG